jgi:hypothetical protein
MSAFSEDPFPVSYCFTDKGYRREYWCQKRMSMRLMWRRNLRTELLRVRLRWVGILVAALVALPLVIAAVAVAWRVALMAVLG